MNKGLLSVHWKKNDSWKVHEGLSGFYYDQSDLISLSAFSNEMSDCEWGEISRYCLPQTDQGFKCSIH